MVILCRVLVRDGAPSFTAFGKPVLTTRLHELTVDLVTKGDLR